MALNHLEGDYQTSFHHAKKAEELSPNDMSYKEYLFFFHAIPDKLLGNEEALEIANEILKNELNNKVSLTVIRETTN
ncbi:hypothetical protein ASG65_21265 [Bacillus sp. Leaf13]|nr:hypothetical protein ASG65_21265 [Bacillus sp. Leaf13]KRF62753.1 hypothetical protein ASG99_23320 [Bacillus sp. Soil768D1]